MRKIISYLYMTLDNVVEAPGSGDTNEKIHGWTEPFFSPDMGEYIIGKMNESDAMLLGATTYRGFAAFWPGIPETDEFGGRMNNGRKYVVSNTLTEATWKNSTLIKGSNAAEELLKLKQQPGKDINVTGSGTLVSWLLQHDLLDELQIMVFPVVLGEGKRLFERGEPKKTLKLVNTQLFSSGVQLNVYQPAK